MRSTLPLLIISAWAAAAGAQTALTTQAAGARQAASQQTGSQQAASGSTAAGPAAAIGSAPARAHPPAARTARHSAGARSKTRRGESATGVTKRGPAAGADGGVLALGASDITGNKELPKVMVIVPWKSPADAGAVVGPEDSVMNEVLGPVDRGVFQRRIRYYGQLDAAGERPAKQSATPVGDSR